MGQAGFTCWSCWGNDDAGADVEDVGIMAGLGAGLVFVAEMMTRPDRGRAAGAGDDHGADDGGEGVKAGRMGTGPGA